MVRTAAPHRAPPPNVCGPGSTVACRDTPGFASLLHLPKFYLSLFSLSCSVFIPFPAVCAPAGTLAYKAGLERSFKCPQDWDAPALTLTHGAHCCSQMHPQFPVKNLLPASGSLTVHWCTQRLCAGTRRETICAWTFLCGKVFKLQL